MIRIIVDSGSSIKQSEKDMYNVDIIPLKIIFDGKEYLDGIDLSNEEFYDFLMNQNKFPKTSLPCFEDIEKLVNGYIEQGDQVLIITISSKISGTYNALKLFFENQKDIYVYDSLNAVGAIRILVQEANRYKDQGIDEVIKKLDELLPRIKIRAIPEKLDYLCKGGRLSKSAMILGNILGIMPVIGFKEGGVSVVCKKRGMKKALNYLIEELEDCDTNHEIVASYTYNKNNIDKLVSMMKEEHKKAIQVYDNLDHAIACHWGPNAFGVIFVSK